MGRRDIVQLSMLVENSSKKVDSLGRKIESLERALKIFNTGKQHLMRIIETSY